MSFLRELFGPSRDEIWRQFAEAFSGQFIEGGFWSRGKVEATHGQWTVTLDTYTRSNGKHRTSYTRMRAPYVNPDGFQFNIYRRGFFSELGSLLGIKDVTVGFPQFDEDFVIKGNEEGKLRRLFANAKIRALIEAQPTLNFSVRDDEASFWSGRNFPPDVDELYFQVRGVIKDVPRLKLLFDLFSETLDELCRMGSADEKDPGVKL